MSGVVRRPRVPRSLLSCSIVLLVAVVGSFALPRPLSAAGSSGGAIPPPTPLAPSTFAPVTGSGSSATGAPHPASKINPTAGYSHEPAPMGIADFGVTGPGTGGSAYSYSTPALEGTANIGSMSVAFSGHPASDQLMAFELNAVIVLQLGGANYSYWIQNGLHVNATNRQYSIGGAYVWNFSSPTARLSTGELRGNSSSVLATDTLYFIPSCSANFAGQCSTLTWPDTITGRIVTGVASGLPYVAYQYDLGAGWVTYDNVSFLHMGGATDLGFVVDGFAPTPINSRVFYDAEWVWVGAGGGSTATAKSTNLSLGLDYWNGRNFQGVPSAWDFGSNTGETSSNVSVGMDGAAPGGAALAVVTNGAGSLGPLYNATRVGALNLSLPTSAPATVTVGGVPTSCAGGGANLTLAAGTYDVSMSNYSNATRSVTVVAGATTFLNFSGAGRVAFQETGLPSGTTWGVSIDGALSNRTAPTPVVVNLANGSYTVAYAPVPGFQRNASAPTTLEMPSVTVVSVDWTPFTFGVPFEETGLPVGTSWWVQTAEELVQGSGSTLTVPAPNGSTDFSVGASFPYLANPPNGTIVVTAGAVAPFTVEFSVLPGSISGTVRPADATVTVDGTAVDVFGGNFSVDAAVGNHTVLASAPGYVPKSVTVEVVAGNDSIVHLVLTKNSSGSNSTPTASSSPPAVDPVLLVGLIVVIAVVVGAVLVLRMRRTGPPE